MTAPTTRGVAALGAYIAAVVAANVATSVFHLVPVWPGMLAVAGTYAAGLALLFRDIAQDAAGRWPVCGAIVAAAAISAATAGWSLALASGAAFAVGEGLDMAVYTPLRRRGWTLAVVASNIVGGIVDTVVFLSLAPGIPLDRSTVLGQLVGKLLWATGATVLLVNVGRLIWRSVRPRRLAVVRRGES